VVSKYLACPTNCYVFARFIEKNERPINRVSEKRTHLRLFFVGVQVYYGNSDLHIKSGKEKREREGKLHTGFVVYV